jgi:arginyl-tRNA--protein-N-Asp/Glu arginylyltransferase
LEESHSFQNKTSCGRWQISMSIFKMKKSQKRCMKQNESHAWMDHDNILLLREQGALLANYRFATWMTSTSDSSKKGKSSLTWATNLSTTV